MALAGLMVLLLTGCAVKRTVAGGIPSEVLLRHLPDSELWKHDATPQQSDETLKLLHTKLGKVESRTVNSATEQQNSGGPLKGRAFIVTYQTKFELGEAMETFTLVEADGRWKLARYLVNSTALK